jgi:hypothetical protein
VKFERTWPFEDMRANSPIGVDALDQLLRLASTHQAHQCRPLPRDAAAETPASSPGAQLHETVVSSEAYDASRSGNTAETGSGAASLESFAQGLFPFAVVLTPETTPELIMLKRSFSSYHGDEWNSFARASGGSFLGSWRVVRARRLFGRVKLFDFLLVGARTPLKVGQCAVVVADGKVTFLDKIQLIAAQKHLSGQCLKLVAQHLGAGTYYYGSHWNDEDRFDFTSVPDFVVDEKIFHIDLIDFRDWADFRAYCRGVSENVRRDYRKAKDAAAVVKTRFGLAALRDLFALVTMRAHTMSRNKQHFSRVLDYFLHAVKLAVLGKNGFITTGRIKGRCYSAFFGAQVGSKLYYISGGTRENRLGVGSYLFLTLIEHWFSEHPTGMLLLGDCPGFSDQAIHTYGNSLYRRKLRVRSINGVEFQLKLKHSVCSDVPNMSPIRNECI